MNKVIEEYRKDFISEYLFQKEYLTEEEAKEIEKEGKSFVGLGYVYDDKKYKWYKRIPVDITDDEFNILNSILMVKYAKEMDKKQKTIKNILIFWAIITIIGLLISLGSIMH